MSKQSANQFLETVAQKETLRDKFQTAKNSDEFVSVAKALGYNFTIEDLWAVIKEHSEKVTLRRKTGIWPWLRQFHWNC